MLWLLEAAYEHPWKDVGLFPYFFFFNSATGSATSLLSRSCLSCSFTAKGASFAFYFSPVPLRRCIKANSWRIIAYACLSSLVPLPPHDTLPPVLNWDTYISETLLRRWFCLCAKNTALIRPVTFFALLRWEQSYPQVSHLTSNPL